MIYLPGLAILALLFLSLAGLIAHFDANRELKELKDKNPRDEKRIVWLESECGLYFWLALVSGVLAIIVIAAILFI